MAVRTPFLYAIQSICIEQRPLDVCICTFCKAEGPKSLYKLLLLLVILLVIGNDNIDLSRSKVDHPGGCLPTRRVLPGGGWKEPATQDTFPVAATPNVQ